MQHFLLRHDRERDLRHLQRVFPADAARLEDGAKALFHLRWSSAGAAVPHQAVIRHLVSGVRGTEPALGLPVLESGAAPNGCAPPRLQSGVRHRARRMGGRNAISVGKFGLTEEYGAAALIERFAYDDMTAREFWLASPYCVHGVRGLA